MRHLNEPFGNSFIVRRNGVDMLATERADGISNMKVKLKYWALKWRSSTPARVNVVGLLGPSQISHTAAQEGFEFWTNDYSHCSLRRTPFNTRVPTPPPPSRAQA